MRGAFGKVSTEAVQGVCSLNRALILLLSTRHSAHKPNERNAFANVVHLIGTMLAGLQAGTHSHFQIPPTTTLAYPETQTGESKNYSPKINTKNIPAPTSGDVVLSTHRRVGKKGMPWYTLCKNYSFVARVTHRLALYPPCLAKQPPQHVRDPQRKWLPSPSLWMRPLLCVASRFFRAHPLSLGFLEP